MLWVSVYDPLSHGNAESMLTQRVLQYRRVYTVSQQVARELVALPRLLEGNVGILPERERLLFARHPIGKSPAPTAVRCDKHIQTAAVRDLSGVSNGPQFCNGIWRQFSHP